MRTIRKQTQHDNFRMQYFSELPESAIEWALQQRAEWVAQGPENARVVVLTRLPDYPEPVVLKFHPTVQRRHVGHRTKGSALRQLTSRYAASEVDAFLKVVGAGVGTPQVLAWGERWQRMLRYEGLVVTQFIPGDDLECRLQKDDFSWLDMAAKGMAALHNAGLVHRDTYPQNFFERDGALQMIDLESVDKLDRRTQIRDLIGLFVPIWVKTGSSDLTQEAFKLYQSYCNTPPTEAEWAGELDAGYQRIHKRWQTGLRSTRNSYVINRLEPMG